MEQNRGVVERRSYGKLKDVIRMPGLLDIQVASYEAFLQADVPPQQRKRQGLQAVFQSIFPITDVHNQYTLEFVEYAVGKPKYSVRECQDRDTTYAAPLRATLRLIAKDRQDKDRIKDIVEQTVFLGELPLMTEKGTFVINGSERVAVSQLHRSPGIFFDETTHPNGKRLLSSRIIPYRGAWVEFTMDINDAMYVHIDKKRKLSVTTLLRALDFSSDGELASLFRGLSEVRKVDEDLIGMIIFQDVETENPEARPVVRWMKKLAADDIEQLKSMGVSSVKVLSRAMPRVDDDLPGNVLYDDIVDEATGEVFSRLEVITPEMSREIRRMGRERVPCVALEPKGEVDVIDNSIAKDPSKSTEQALTRIYGLLRPGDPPNIETARGLLDRLFFHPKRYYLGEVGRYRINERLGTDIPLSSTVLHKQDFVSIIAYLLTLRRGEGYTDDIDHLGNRRVRSVGELLSNQFSVGLSRMARTIRERMSLRDSESLTPHELVNARTVSTVINSFFGSSQLSQFMQQINPLDELTHKRRLSALGPGGLARDRAGFEVRDVHHTHYGRICPIETPEGPNIGLIASLSTYARVNPYGFLETPFRVVQNGAVVDRMSILDPGIVGMTSTEDLRDPATGAIVVRVGEEFTKENAALLSSGGLTDAAIVRYLSADQEDKYTVAPANAVLDADGRFVGAILTARRRGDFPVVAPSEIDFMDVSPKQLVSAAAALIPFLEHDDANRALMGSNMQRQAVPMLRTEAPLIGTGLERQVALDSGVVVTARRAGLVTYVSADRIVVRRENSIEDDEALLDLLEDDVYELTKFKLSNQQTCINQKPIVSVGDRVAAGEVLADGQSTDKGELALGANVMVAFMPWNGCNFEDAIVVSEKLLTRDVFTTIHIEEFQLQVRDTKRGAEEITKEIPNVGEQAIRNLDDQGIIRVGAEIKPGDILVGKVTPKGETELSPEERLLRAIFGEKAGDVRDASLRAPSGMDGVAMDRMIFSRKERDEKTKRLERDQKVRLEKEAAEKILKIKDARDRLVTRLLAGRKIGVLRNVSDNRVVLAEGQFLDEEAARAIDLDNVRADSGEWTDDLSVSDRVSRVIRVGDDQISGITEELEQEVDKLVRGDELPPGIVQLVNVYIARKRKLSVGDKMAGRHGNKGVVAKIVPAEDMPYLPDGTPVDIVLNPLGVPSRMNLGQVFETHLGWAAHKLGIKIETPVFAGATLDEIKEALREAGLPETGKTVLYDGMTGERYDQEVVVGNIYMMKLLHLVSDKIHARSIGPYSLVTQQPLGGKAQFGGQRFGEMEVWALEAYGAAYLLQEMLTVKSDDVIGRSRIYEAIVKGETPPEPGIPESFNVLVKELQSLCLDVRLEDGSH